MDKDREGSSDTSVLPIAGSSDGFRGGDSDSRDMGPKRLPGWTKPPDLDEIAVAGSGGARWD